MSRSEPGDFSFPASTALPTILEPVGQGFEPKSPSSKGNPTRAQNGLAGGCPLPSYCPLALSPVVVPSQHEDGLGAHWPSPSTDFTQLSSWWWALVAVGVQGYGPQVRRVRPAPV